MLYLMGQTCHDSDELVRGKLVGEGRGRANIEWGEPPETTKNLSPLGNHGQIRPSVSLP